MEEEEEKKNEKEGQLRRDRDILGITGIGTLMRMRIRMKIGMRL